MQTIDFKNHLSERDFVQWALCSLIADKYKQIMPEGSKSIFEIEVKINGVEVDFLAMCKSLEDNYERAVKGSALDLFTEKLSELSNVIYEVTEKAERLAKEKLNFSEEY